MTIKLIETKEVLVLHNRRASDKHKEIEVTPVINSHMLSLIEILQTVVTILELP